MGDPRIVLALSLVITMAAAAPTLIGLPGLGSPLQVVKVLSVGSEPGAGPTGTLGSSLSIALPPPTAALDALVAWKKALLTPPLLPLPPPKPLPPPPPPLPPPPPPHHHHHYHHYHHVGGCCGCGHCSSSEDSSAASSEEDLVGSQDARLQRCVRTVAPNMLVDGSYAHVAQMDACAARGMQALAAGSTPPDARDTITSCLEAVPFPSSLSPFVQDFEACVARVLT